MEKNIDNLGFYDFPKIQYDNKVFWEIVNIEVLVKNKGIKVQLGEDFDYQVAVFYVNNNLYCLSNICPHKHIDRIFEGFIKDGTVTCPEHGWTYLLQTGENINQEVGIKSLQTFNIMEMNGKVYIEEPNFVVPKWRAF